jgi:radical SAM protein with 4Fe4S-binding SPASM domain
MRNIFQRFKGKFKPNSNQGLSKELKESKVFCMLPWVHLHALPGGNIYPCCTSAHLNEAAIGNFNKGDTISSVWNGEKMKAIRNKMLKGEKLSICEKCYAEQERGQENQRNSSINTFSNHFERINKTLPDGSIPNNNIPYLDFRFSNLCNLRCRICSHEYSTSWYKEQKELRVGYSAPRKINISNNLDSLWKQLEPYLEGLEMIHFAGGEPLIMEEHYLILKRLHELKKFNIQITYNTNLTVRKFKNHDLFELWKDFNNVLVMASLDGMGAKGEYLRKDQNWEQTEKLRREMMKVCPNVRFRLDPTISIHNVLHIPDFYEEWDKKGLHGIDGIRINILYGPEEYSIVNLPETLKEKVNARYKEFLAEHKSNTQVQKEFNAILTYMFSKKQNLDVSFKATTEKLDNLRDESFRETFPELKEMMND